MMDRRNVLAGIAGIGGLTLTGLHSHEEARDLMNSFMGGRGWRVQTKWDMETLFGKTGASGCQALVDTTGDGRDDLVCNVGAQAHFAAVDQDQNILWENVQNTTKAKYAQTPKIADGALFYGHRANDTVYAINLSDGTLRWSYAANGNLQGTEIVDVGVAVGSKGTNGEVAVLNYADGTVRSGWPVAFTQHQQRLSAGDLDGDGQDELMLNDNSGNIEVRNRDASLKFSISSSHSHTDVGFIVDMDPTHSGKELLVVVDDDNSHTNEGDEIVTYDAAGNQLNKYTAASNGPSPVVGNFLPDNDGLEVFFGVEGTGDIGLLDGTLTEQWTRSVSKTGSNPAGQTWACDVDGDGTLELFANTDESPDSGGFYAYRPNGDYVGKANGMGWQVLVLPSEPSGDPNSQVFPEERFRPALVAPSDTSTADIVRVVDRSIS